MIRKLITQMWCVSAIQSVLKSTVPRCLKLETPLNLFKSATIGSFFGDKKPMLVTFWQMLKDQGESNPNKNGPSRTHTSTHIRSVLMKKRVHQPGSTGALVPSPLQPPAGCPQTVGYQYRGQSPPRLALGGYHCTVVPIRVRVRARTQTTHQRKL